MRFLAVTLCLLALATLLVAQQPPAPTAAGNQQNAAPTAQPAAQGPPVSQPSAATQPTSEPAPSAQTSSQPSAQTSEIPSTMPPGTSIVLTETPKERAQAQRAF